MKTKRIFLIVLMIASILLSVLAWSAGGSPVSAKSGTAVRYVKPGMSGSCASWATACDLKKALADPGTVNEIWVAEGTYLPDTTGLADPRKATFQLKNGAALYGGFAGNETSRDQRDPSAHVTILSGDIGALNNSGDNSYHVVTGSGTDATAILDGFTIRGGNANGVYPFDRGGGMYNDGGSPTLTNLTFSANSAANTGGGMANLNSSSPTLTNLTFSSNSASSGGGMYNYINSSPTLTNVIFSANSAADASGGGGGIYDDDSSPTLINVVFFANSTAGSGGGMRNANWSNPTLIYVIFSNNSAAGKGGGMSNIVVSSKPILTNVIFSANSANLGGGMSNESASPTLTNVTFSANSATGDGGGIYNIWSGNPILTNVTFSANTASSGSGGGMLNWECSPTLTNVTIYANSAASGGGIDNTGGNLNMLNSVVWGNTHGNLQLSGTATAITYSDIQDWTLGGEGNIALDPLLGPLANDGGYTLTHALLPGSPAIDAGSPTVCPATDQRGLPRPIDGDLKNGPRCDMGAVEYVEFVTHVFLPQVRH